MQSRAKWGITVLLLALLALSWTRLLDDAAQTATLTNFKRALAVAAIARGFNGIISVAQGTEVVLQPIGIGVTLTIGEILDPLNDLIERFSALALMASAALGLQLTLGQMVTSPWLSAMISVAVMAYLIMLWRPPPLTQASTGWRHRSLRVIAVFVFVRFLLAVVLLTTHFLNTAFLSENQARAVANLTIASTNIEQLQDSSASTRTGGAPEEDFFDRTAAQLRNFLDATSQTFDLKAQLAQLQQQVENTVEEIINLIVIFLLQTLLFPIASMWLCWKALQGFWRWSRSAASISKTTNN